MTCAEADEHLDDYVDDGLSEGKVQELELHLAGCAGCREQERLLRHLLADAEALPRELAPRRDLWPGIRARLGRPGVLPFSHSSSRPGSWLPAALAAAAAVALALAALVRTPETAHDPGRASAFPAGSSSEVAGVLKAETDYAQASAALLAALRERPERLSAETLAALEKSLLVIDAALAQIREALAQDPGSGALNHLLASTHQRKLKVLQRVEKLSRI